MKILRACLAAGFLAASVVGTVSADDNLRRYQQSLRNQGFYYGPIDGNPGDETTQALRRYQIRNGLPVTGQLDDQTRHAIDRGPNDNSAQSTPGPLATPPPPPPPPRPTPPPPPPVGTPPPPPPSLRRDTPADDRDDSRPAPGRNGAPDGPQRFAPSAALTNYFGGTPYEFAPPPVQADTVRRAQQILTRLGFYDDEPDGRPSHDLAEAVSNFQEVRRLRRSGRLDTATLTELRLMPDRRSAPPRRGDGDERNRVYDGRVIR